VRRIKSCLYNSPHPNLLPLEKEIILKSTALPKGEGWVRGNRKYVINISFMSLSVIKRNLQYLILTSPHPTPMLLT